MNDMTKYDFGIDWAINTAVIPHCLTDEHPIDVGLGVFTAVLPCPRL